MGAGAIPIEGDQGPADYGDVLQLDGPGTPAVPVSVENVVPVQIAQSLGGVTAGVQLGQTETTAHKLLNADPQRGECVVAGSVAFAVGFTKPEAEAAKAVWPANVPLRFRNGLQLWVMAAPGNAAAGFVTVVADRWVR